MGAPALRHLRIAGYEEARKRLGSRSSRLVANNTWLSDYEEQEIVLCLHDYGIVYFTPSSTTLYSRGWRTYTTKDRLNRCLPVGWGLFQHKFYWWLWQNGTREGIPFEEGMQWDTKDNTWKDAKGIPIPAQTVR